MRIEIFNRYRSIAVLCICSFLVLTCPVTADAAKSGGREVEKEVTLRVCNWEEYIDLGDWDEEETIELDSGDIIGENTMIEDFTQWYYETYGIRVRVEYSTFGTK